MQATVGGLQEDTETLSRAIWHLAPHGMVVLQLNLASAYPLRHARWLMANPATESLLPESRGFAGARVEELGSGFLGASPDALLRWEEQLRRQGGFSDEMTSTSGGQPFVLHVHAVQSGPRLLVWLRDVTAERREVESLKRGRDLFRTVIHNAPDAIFAKDLQGRYTVINPAGARALGTEPQNVIGSTDQELFVPTDAQATRAHDQAVLAAGRSLTYEDDDLEGGRSWQSTKGVLRDESGAVTGLFGISRDITAHKRLERSLRDSERRYQLVARATRDLLWDWNVARNEMSWSTALGEVFGEVPREDRSSFRWWKQRIHPEDRQRHLDILHEAMGSGRDCWANEYRFRRADGTYAVVLERGYIDRDAARRPERLLGTMMDVSERKQREEEKAREAELLERFMGILGHDLGSPLAAIRITAQLLRQAPNLLPAQQVMIDRLLASTTRVTRLTQQLLDSVQARGGGIPMRPESVDLAPLCRRVLDELGAIYPQHTLQLEVEGTSRGEWDRDRLAQLISNLVGNALEHGEHSEPIHVRLRDDHGWQRLEVNNQGKPIAPSLLPHLFEPFRRGRASERRASGGGVGLGLFIVREIARAHHGEVEVRSSDGEGTTFSLVLPRDAGLPH